MFSQHTLVQDFLQALDKHQFVERVEEQDSFVKIFTTKFLIIIYSREQDKIAFDTNASVIHLDIDVLEQSFAKVVKRIEGLNGMGQRIYARQTVVARIDKRVCMLFQDDNHLQTAMPGKYRYGLFYKGDLVSIAVFSGGRRQSGQEDDYRSFELIRFCHKADVLVVGGISKLIKSFISDFEPNDIMTYSDMDWSNKSSLESIGFQELERKEGQDFFIVNGQRLSHLAEAQDYDYKVTNSGSIKLKLFV